MREYIIGILFFLLIIGGVAGLAILTYEGQNICKSKEANIKHVEVNGDYELELCVDEVGQKYYKGSDGAKFDIENKMALDSTQPKQEPTTTRWILNNQTGEYDLAT